VRRLPDRWRFREDGAITNSHRPDRYLADRCRLAGLGEGAFHEMRFVVSLIHGA
jgi:hypothetical protein